MVSFPPFSFLPSFLFVNGRWQVVPVLSRRVDISALWLSAPPLIPRRLILSVFPCSSSERGTRSECLKFKPSGFGRFVNFSIWAAPLDSCFSRIRCRVDARGPGFPSEIPFRIFGTQGARGKVCVPWGLSRSCTRCCPWRRPRLRRPHARHQPPALLVFFFFVSGGLTPPAPAALGYSSPQQPQRQIRADCQSGRCGHAAKAIQFQSPVQLRGEHVHGVLELEQLRFMEGWARG